MYTVVSIEDAKRIMEKEFKHQLHYEEIDIADAVDRYCFEDIIAQESIPGFMRSTVDGYAVNSRDVFGASESMPAMLELVGEVSMGKSPTERLEGRGRCMYVPTGGMLPDGADSVVMVEYSAKLDSETVLIEKPSAPLENVIQAGEDIKNGEVVLTGGGRLRPYEIGVLSSLGMNSVKVYRKPVIGIISTGDEVVAPDCKPKPGQVRDINTNLLVASVIRTGSVPRVYGIISDEFELLKNTVDRAVDECDLVLVSGGSSVGTKDQTLKVINSYTDGGVLVHGLAVKPGKPTIIGKAHEKAIFGLPGHPLACSIIFTVLVSDYIYRLNNHKSEAFGVSAKFSINYHKAKGREEYLPVAIERKAGVTVARPIFGKSGLITSFSKAYGYIAINKNKEGLLEGEQVEVYKL